MSSPGIFATTPRNFTRCTFPLPLPPLLLESQRRPPLQSPCGVVVVFPPLGSVSRGFDPLLFCPKQKHGCLEGRISWTHAHFWGISWTHVRTEEAQIYSKGFRGHTCARRKLRFIVKDIEKYRVVGSGRWMCSTTIGKRNK